MPEVGNFLTETYLSLRKMENKALDKLHRGQIQFGDSTFNPIKVSIGQFYGIEINDFAVTVAKTALWIAESQMMHETENLLHLNLDFLPLKSYTNIIEGNALKLDWNEVVPKEELNYIMGNPPFVGGKDQTREQKEEITAIFGKNFKNLGHLDYVASWYKKSAEYIQNTHIEIAFVSTNSIAQGEHVAVLWKYLFEELTIKINFAYTTFNWESEAKEQAGVHCVIIGFACFNRNEKVIFNDKIINKVNHINGYLVDGPDVWIERISAPLQDVPSIGNGNVPLDNAICAFKPEEMYDFVKKEPNSKPYFYRYMGGYEFINNIERYFLVINKIPPDLLKKMPSVIKKLDEIREYRLNSGVSARKLADTPSKFHYENMPTNNFLAIPQTSSGRRRYIPIGFLSPNVLVNNKLQIMNNATLYEFGILMSNVHNSWVRYVCGRLRNDFTYSVGIVYNNFPWPKVTEQQKKKIMDTAQNILDIRNKYTNTSLADLYDDLTMPNDLRTAHQKNDIAVMEAYGFDWHNMTESDCVAELMKMYQELTSK